MSEQAPFIPPRPDEDAIPPQPWRVFGSRAYFRLWVAQVFSSLGDWIGLFAILAVASRVSGDNAAALSLVMVARMVPGFILAPVCGAFVDRWDRKRVMVVTDFGRAGILVLVPFVDSLAALVVASFALEVLTLFWGPAKDASVPQLVPADGLTQANSLSLVAAFGTFPIAGFVFAGLAGLAEFLGGFDALDFFEINQESVALVFDALTFVASAVFIIGLPIPKTERSEGERVDLTQTWRDIKEGIHFVAGHKLVRGVMIGMSVGLIGGGMMVPLGPVFSNEVLGEATSGFGILMTALGVGAAIGVASLVAFQRRLPREQVFSFTLFGVGVGIIAAATVSTLAFSALLVVFVGACAGATYVTGFTILQENTSDEVRGRTFAALYTIIRVCLLLALTVSPLFASLFGELSEALLDDGAFDLGGQTLRLPGVRLALWMGGLICVSGGFVARSQIRKALAERDAEARPA